MRVGIAVQEGAQLVRRGLGLVVGGWGEVAAADHSHELARPIADWLALLLGQTEQVTDDQRGERSSDAAHQLEAAGGGGFVEQLVDVFADAGAGGLHGTRGEEARDDRAEAGVDRRIGAANDRGVADRRAEAGAGDELSEATVASGGVVRESDVVAEGVVAVVVAGEHPAVRLPGTCDWLGATKSGERGVWVLLVGGSERVE